MDYALIIRSAKPYTSSNSTITLIQLNTATRTLTQVQDMTTATSPINTLLIQVKKYLHEEFNCFQLHKEIFLTTESTMQLSLSHKN